MKAAVLTDTNTFVLAERPMPVRGEDEVILRVRAAGVCGSDLPRVFAGKVYHFPLVLGHEFAGEVVDAADSQMIGHSRRRLPTAALPQVRHVRKRGISALRRL